MEALALYLTKSTVWLTGFALVYLLFLRNERFFLLNRIYLVAGILVSIVFPLFTWHYTVVVPVTPTVEVSELQMMGPVDIPEPFPIQAILFYIYLAGALYLLFRITRQTLAVIKVIRKSEIHPYPSAKLILTTEYPASFSFFSFVFVNPSTCDIETNEIVNHEMEHIRQQHWIDLLLFEILCTLQWFNPLSWLYGRFIRQNHEYLADERALQRSSNPGIYRAALLNQLFGGPVISLANSFNYSINKKRFHMMKQTIYSPIRKLKLLLVLPLIAGIFYAFATPEYTYAPSDQEEILTILDTRTITGKVVNGEGVPLKGASVIISEKTIGTITDNDGNFVIQITDDSPLVISYVGYQSQKVTPNFDKEMFISMKKENIGVEEVTVVGLATNSNQSSSIQQPFKVQTNSPMQFRSSDGTKNPPLVVIDGVIAENQNANSIDPETIESINVLKDASATALYGDKGKNGVVEITLKGEGRVIGYGSNNQKITSIQQPFKVQTNSPMQFGKSGGSNNPPLVVINGVIADNQNVNNVDPETIQSIDVLKNESSISKYGDKGKNGVIEITLKNGSDSKNDPQLNGTAKDQKENTVFKVVEQMPEFPGGDVALRNFIATSVKYPALAQQNNIQGKVYVAFVVTKTGGVANARIVRGVDPSLDREAIRVVNSLPTWTPGKQGGKNVDVEYTIPINFLLQAGKTDETKPQDSPVFFIVEEMPKFPGGEEALRSFIASAVKYPAEAQQKGIQGKVYINFVVGKTGSIATAKVARGVAPSLDQEAIRVIESMPAWIPGKQKGVSVDVSYTIPINFVLAPSKISDEQLKSSGKQSDAVFFIVEEMPEFPGGDAALRKFIAASVKYPAEAQQKRIQGKVYITFVVTKTGNVTDAKVARGQDPLLDQEALRVVNLLPTWKPGKQKGENVSVSYTIPINFVLEKEVTPPADPTVQKKKLIIVPNPTQNIARVTLEGSDSTNQLEVSIFSSYGKLISKETKNGPSFSLTVSNLTPGTYLVVATDGTTQYQGQMIVNN